MLIQWSKVLRVLLTLFYFRLFVLTALLPPPLVITNMFPIVTLTSFETMSEPRSARSAGSCFSPNSNNTIIVSLSLSCSVSSLTRNMGPAAISGKWPRSGSKYGRWISRRDRANISGCDQTYNVDCQSEHSYRLIFLPLCQPTALFWLNPLKTQRKMKLWKTCDG